MSRAAALFLTTAAILTAQPQSFSLHYPDLNQQDTTKLILAAQPNAFFIVSTSTKTTTITNIHITRTDTHGTVLGTFDFGGSGADTPINAAVDPQGNLVIVGTTQSADFPLVAAAQSTGAAFVTKLDAQLTHIVFSTRFAGPGDIVSAVATDPAGNIYITGSTAQSAASVATTPGVLQSQAPTITPPATLINGYVSEFSPAGQIRYSTYFGASGYTCYQASSPCLVIIGPHGTVFGAAVFTKPTAIAVDNTGAVVIAGSSNANNLPATSTAYSQQCGCNNLLGAAFVAKLSPGGTSVVWGTYIPLTQLISLPPSTITPTTIKSIALDSAGNIVLAGTTPQYFPVTTGALQTAFPVPSPDVYSQAGFVAKLDTTASRLLFSTFLGGGSTGPSVLALDAAGAIWLSGSAPANQLPPSSTPILGTDYLAQLSPTGATLTSVTTAPAGAAAAGVAIAPDGTIAALGSSGSVLLSSTATTSILGVASSPAPSISSAVVARELISIYGINLSPVTSAAQITGVAIARSLGGVQLLFDGAPAALLYVSPTQINAIVPAAVSGRLTTTIQLITPAGTITGPTLAVRDTAPQVFTTTGGYAVALNQDGTVNAPLNRAQPGSIVTIWFTGGGASASSPDGVVNTNASRSLYPVSVISTGTNESLDVLYAGDAPGSASGVMQVNFRLEPTPEQVSLDYLLQVGTASTRFFVNAID